MDDMSIGGPDRGAGPSIVSRCRHRSAPTCDSLSNGSPTLASGDVALIDSSTTVQNFWHRAGWLVMLLSFQSCSSFILQRFDVLIRTHPVIIYFLTMLVGAGGNVGGQSVLLGVRRLALSKIGSNSDSKGGDEQGAVRTAVCNELSVGCRLSIILVLASAVRCEAFEVRGMECAAICLSMLAIVVTSAVLGAALPLFFRRLKIDEACASPVIQVLMDAIGVTLTCVVSCLVLGIPLSGNLDTPHLHHPAPAHMRRTIQHQGTRHGLDVFGN